MLISKRIKLSPLKLFGKSGLFLFPFLLGLLFFAASLTPTLIPRSWVVQGLLGGLLIGVGYAIGRAIIFVWRFLRLPEPSGSARLVVSLVGAAPILIIFGYTLSQARNWQNSIRGRMGMELLESFNTTQTLLLAAAVFVVLLLLGFGLRWVFDRVRRRLHRYMPARTGNLVGLILICMLLFFVTRNGVFDRVIDRLDKSVTVAQALFDRAPPPPDGNLVSGGDGSFVDWGALGKPGRKYVTNGPTSTDISTFLGREAKQPIRVYVGRAQAETAQERADVALAELKRQGGFDREVLIIAMPTGTGWLDPGAVDPVEYMHGGDIATVAVQYSYLQSSLALILETQSGLDQAKALIKTVHQYWQTLPKNARPRLYVHGLSLGAWTSMNGTDVFTLLDDPIDGAFWAGPPFPSAMWQSFVQSRNKNSPYVSPVLRDSRLVRFATHFKDAGGAKGWGDMRIVFLQYTSDPIVFYEPASLFREPKWMAEKPAPDVSPLMQFTPVVTQFQLAVDMALATTAPPGFGHSYYGPDYIGPWVALTDPKSWTEQDTKRLIQHCDVGFKKGCKRIEK